MPYKQVICSVFGNSEFQKGMGIVREIKEAFPEVTAIELRIEGEGGGNQMKK